MVLLLGDVSLMFGPIQLRIWMTGIAHLMMDDPMLSDFSIYHTFDVILGHISVLVELFRSPLICMIIPTYEIHAETMTYLLSYHDLVGKPLLSHLVKPTLLIFRCPHASSSRRRLFYVQTRFSCGFGLLGLHI